MEAVIHCWSASYDVSVRCDIPHHGALDRDMVYRALREHFDWNDVDVLGEAEAAAIRPYVISPRGYFPDADALIEDMYRAALGLLPGVIERFQVEFFVDSAAYQPDAAIDINEIMLAVTAKKMEDNRDCENGVISIGEKIMESFTQFIEQGVWQTGFMNASGDVLANARPLPMRDAEHRRIQWLLDGQAVEPVVWFGLRGEKPVKCWTISRAADMFMKRDYAPPHDVERWKAFWFDTFWVFDWVALTDNDESLIIWMFAECGLVEPDIEPVRERCPIPLREMDTEADLIAKIDWLFLRLVDSR